MTPWEFVILSLTFSAGACLGMTAMYFQARSVIKHELGKLEAMLDRKQESPPCP